MKKIAVPVQGTNVSAHFGHAPQFKIFSVEDKNIVGEDVLENPGHQPGLLPRLLNEAGADLEINEDNVICNKVDSLKKTDIVTYYYPGFPTDLQQPFSVFLTKCEGKSKIEEKIYENRFMHVPYLEKMGANIAIKGQKAFVEGPTALKGSEVTATDLRAGAALVIAGLIAKGKTQINEVEHILRG